MCLFIFSADCLLTEARAEDGRAVEWVSGHKVTPDDNLGVISRFVV